MVEVEGISPTWFLTSEQNESSHMAFADTFWFAWNSACVKLNWTKGKMHMNSNSSTDLDWVNQTKVWNLPNMLMFKCCSDLCSPQSWSDEVEANAEKWAKTCSLDHSPRSFRKTNSKFILQAKRQSRTTTVLLNKFNKHFVLLLAQKSTEIALNNFKL